MKKLGRIFSKLLAILVIWIFISPAAIGASTNIPFTEIGDNGAWMTEYNIEQFKQSISSDMIEFQTEAQTKQLLPDYVPIEAKIGFAMMDGLSLIADILDSSLVRFAIIFMIVAYIFWLMFETYNMMTKGSSAMELGVNLVKRGALITIWSIILVQGPAQVFMWIMGPIISIATYMSDLILNAVANSAGAELPDTCAAIREYAAAHANSGMIIDAKAAADMLCVPTRLSGFFTTAVAAGWKWLIAGVTSNAFTALVGAIFIVVFIYNAFKFALMGLGVIMDLFLAVLMLPFTALAETIKSTSYKGIAGDIFNGFLGLFKTESLSNQIKKFINAAIYFVSLSIVIALCAALLSGTVDANLAAAVPTLDNNGFIVTLLTGLLVAYLANKAEKIAEDLGGTIKYDFGTKFGEDVKKLSKNIYQRGKSIYKFFKDND